MRYLSPGHCLYRERRSGKTETQLCRGRERFGDKEGRKRQGDMAEGLPLQPAYQVRLRERETEDGMQMAPKGGPKSVATTRVQTSGTCRADL